MIWYNSVQNGDEMAEFKLINNQLTYTLKKTALQAMEVVTGAEDAVESQTWR